MYIMHPVFVITTPITYREQNLQCFFVNHSYCKSLISLLEWGRVELLRDVGYWDLCITDLVLAPINDGLSNIWHITSDGIF